MCLGLILANNKHINKAIVGTYDIKIVSNVVLCRQRVFHPMSRINFVQKCKVKDLKKKT